MIIRELDPDQPDALVTFALPEDVVPGGAISVVGDFNDWDPHAHPLAEQGGWRRATVRIPAGRRYRFRYLVEPDQWLNDDAADDYQPNPHGGHDAVLDLTDPTRPDAAGSSGESGANSGPVAAWTPPESPPTCPPSPRPEAPRRPRRFPAARPGPDLGHPPERRCPPVGKR